MFEQGLRGRISSPTNNADDSHQFFSPQKATNLSPTFDAAASSPSSSIKSMQPLPSPGSVNNRKHKSQLLRENRIRKKKTFRSMGSLISRFIAIALASCCLCLFCVYIRRSGDHYKEGAIRGAGRRGGVADDRDALSQRRNMGIGMKDKGLELESGDVIHIVHTNFMQNQPDLLELGKARLELFRTFCLPSMIHQKATNFIWIIRTDPDLDKSLRNHMVELLAPYPNFILLASNNQRTEFRSDEFIADGLNDEDVWSGKKTLVERAQDLSETQLVLETILDASDGLHATYIERLQQEAKRYLVVKEEDSTVVDSHRDDGLDIAPSTNDGTITKENALWRIWCANNHAEWHAESPFPPLLQQSETLISKETENGEELPYGYIAILHDEQCITSGITFGYGIGVSHKSIPPTSNQDLHLNIHRCGKQKTNCLRRIEQLAPTVIHPYTSASSLMGDGVDLSLGTTQSDLGAFKNKYKNEGRKQRKKEDQDMMWEGLGVVMHVTKDSGIRMKEYIQGYDKLALNNKGWMKYQ